VTRNLALLLCATGLVVACSSISPETKEDLARPVNCDTADQDIDILEGEKASVARQMLAGVGFVSPPGVVLGILARDTKDRAKIAVGTYNREIEAKIAEIMETCGLADDAPY
jgi:hypothetical protein